MGIMTDTDSLGAFSVENNHARCIQIVQPERSDYPTFLEYKGAMKRYLADFTQCTISQVEKEVGRSLPFSKKLTLKKLGKISDQDLLWVKEEPITIRNSIRSQAFVSKSRRRMHSRTKT